MKISNPEYLAKARLLTEDERERLFSRMAGKLPRRLEKDKLSEDEALAIQMALEAEQLQEWRERMHSMKVQTKAKEKSDKAKKAEDKSARAKGANGRAEATPGKPAAKAVAKPVAKPAAKTAKTAS